MLASYDAKAIAEVMGIAFLPGSVRASFSKAKGSPKPLAASGDEDFVIHVNDAAMLIVEVRTKSTLASFNTPKTFSASTHPVSLPSAIFIEKAVENGLPRKALRHVAERLAGGDVSKVAVMEWNVVPKTTLERRETKLSPQESERTERIARLFVHACRALGTEAEAREFMTMPHPELDGRMPVEAARTDLGARRTEQLLNALEYGLAL